MSRRAPWDDGKAYVSTRVEATCNDGARVSVSLGRERIEFSVRKNDEDASAAIYLDWSYEELRSFVETVVMTRRKALNAREPIARIVGPDNDKD